MIEVCLDIARFSAKKNCQRQQLLCVKSRDVECDVKSRDIKSVVESRDVECDVESRNVEHDVESRDVECDVESRDIEGDIEGAFRGEGVVVVFVLVLLLRLVVQRRVCQLITGVSSRAMCIVVVFLPAIKL